MINKFMTICVLAILTSCNPIDYDSETRLILEGTLVNADGNPLPNQNIGIEAHLNNANNSDRIASGVSDNQGKFQFIVPEPKGDYYFNININNQSNKVQHKEFVGIQRENFNDYRFNTQTVTLFDNSEIALLHFELSQSNPYRVITALSIETIEAPEFVYINHQPDFIPVENQFQVLKNQSVTVHYTVVDSTNTPAITTDYSETFVTNSQDFFSYTINF